MPCRVECMALNALNGKKMFYGNALYGKKAKSHFLPLPHKIFLSFPYITLDICNSCAHKNKSRTLSAPFSSFSSSSHFYVNLWDYEILVCACLPLCIPKDVKDEEGIWTCLFVIWHYNSHTLDLKIQPELIDSDTLSSKRVTCEVIFSLSLSQSSAAS